MFRGGGCESTLREEECDAELDASPSCGARSQPKFLRAFADTRWPVANYR